MKGNGRNGTEYGSLSEYLERSTCLKLLLLTWGEKEFQFRGAETGKSRKIHGKEGKNGHARRRMQQNDRSEQYIKQKEGAAKRTGQIRHERKGRGTQMA